MSRPSASIYTSASASFTQSKEKLKIRTFVPILNEKNTFTDRKVENRHTAKVSVLASRKLETKNRSAR